MIQSGKDGSQPARFVVKQGTEAAARRFLRELQPGQALLKLDVVNAFNAISRDELLRTSREELPELYPFILTCYSSSSHLCLVSSYQCRRSWARCCSVQRHIHWPEC
jgi:hypothetical protein